MKETSPSWSQSVFALLLSAVSSSELLWLACSSSPFSSFLVVCVFVFSLCLDDEAKHFSLSRNVESENTWTLILIVFAGSFNKVLLDQ